MVYTDSLSLFLNTTAMTKKRHPIGSVIDAWTHSLELFRIGNGQSWPRDRHNLAPRGSRNCPI